MSEIADKFMTSQPSHCPAVYGGSVEVSAGINVDALIEQNARKKVREPLGIVSPGRFTRCH